MLGPIPRYGESSLADIVPSMLSALGVEGFANPLGVAPVRRACLLLADGLGWELLRAHPDEAPFLSSAAGRAVQAGFPATTATSVASIGTGMPPGEHGMVGYTFAVAGHDRPLNALSWTPYGARGDLRDTIVPEELQPSPTAFERASADGVAVWQVGQSVQQGSGLTRAVLRGARFRMTFGIGDVAAEACDALRDGDRTFVYAYHPDLDTVGHVRGVSSDAWRYHLAHVDSLCARIAGGLPPDAALVVTGDHGMVDVDGLVDIDDEPALSSGVRVLGGEARARHVYCTPGAATDVADAWRARFGEDMLVLLREQAVADGWFGATVPDRVRERIGDVVAAARGRVGVVQKSVDALQARLVGHHGSMTVEEQLVPFVVVRS